VVNQFTYHLSIGKKKRGCLSRSGEVLFFTHKMVGWYLKNRGGVKEGEL